MTTKFKFTRYLYELEEVSIALMISLLNNDEEVLFWAYELYYSGFKQELVELIWKIYYNFYSSLNPSFEVYLLKKNNIDNFSNPKNISNILNSFLIRPYNLDVFMLRQITKNFEIDIVKENIQQLLSIRDNVNIAYYILEIVKEINMDDVLNIILDYFQKFEQVKINKNKILNLWHKVKRLSDPKVILLSYIIRYYSSLENLKTGKNIYIVVNDEDIILYETIEVDFNINIETKRENLIARKILPIAYLYSIDSSKYMNLFKLKRNKANIKEAYLYNWLYYASYSPLWKARIDAYNGIIDNEKMIVEFEDEDNLQEFYLHYGYEPDEQNKNVEDKCLETIRNDTTNNWTSFYEKYKHNGIVNNCEEYLDEMEQIVW